MADSSAPERDESPAERLDRNWDELLQELRVTQTGIQILFAFLLTIPFQTGFTHLTSGERDLYLVIVVLVAISTVCNLAPIVTHRLLFRKHKKDVLMSVSTSLVKAALATLGLALVGGVGLVVSVVSGSIAGIVIAGGLVALIVTLWLALPLVLLNRHAHRGDSEY